MTRARPSIRALRALSILAVAALAATLSACGPAAAPAKARVKIGFLVKMPEQAWFINESAAARAAGAEQDFDVVTIGTPDGEKLMTAIDNLGAQGAQGFVVCAPDVRLGPAIMARAHASGLKVVTVDDQFLGPDGKPMTDVPHLGMSGYKIGTQVGEAIAAEMRARGWNPAEVGAIELTSKELPTAVERVTGARNALVQTGFVQANLFEAALRSTDTEAGSNAASTVLSRNPRIKKWIIFSLNEESVLGAVRATEQFAQGANQVIGVGIGGSQTAFAEFSKSQPTGFFATVAVSSTRHGRESALNLVHWIRDGVKPPVKTETTGTVMTRANWQQVKAALQL